MVVATKSVFTMDLVYHTAVATQVSRPVVVRAFLLITALQTMEDATKIV